MYAGQVIEQAPTKELLTNPIHEYTRGLLGSVLSIESGSGRLHQVPGAVPSPRDFPKGDRFAPRSSHPRIGWTPVRSSSACPAPSISIPSSPTRCSRQMV